MRLRRVIQRPPADDPLAIHGDEIVLRTASAGRPFGAPRLLAPAQPKYLWLTTTYSPSAGLVTAWAGADHGNDTAYFLKGHIVTVTAPVDPADGPPGPVVTVSPPTASSPHLFTDPRTHRPGVSWLVSPPARDDTLVSSTLQTASLTR